METINVRSLGGGRNTRDSEFELADAQSPDELNLIATRTGAVERRAGFNPFTHYSWTTDPVLGLNAFYKRDQNRYLMVAAGEELWAVDIVNGTQQRLGTGFVPCQPFNFAVMNDWVYIANFADLVYRWDGINPIRQAGLSTPAMPAGASAADTGVSATSTKEAGTRYYRYRVNYGQLGKSNLSTGSVNATSGAAGRQITVSGITDIPVDGVSLELYCTLTNPTLGADSVYYFHSEWGGGDVIDEKSNNDLLLEYEGDIGLPLNAQFVTNHNQRMWYAYCMERDGSEIYPSRVYYSEFNQPDRVDALNFIRVFEDDGDFITGIATLRGNLVVFKKNTIYQVLGFSEADFQVREVHGSVGCIAPLSIASVNNKLYFLGEGPSVYYFDGARSVRVSDVIQPDLDQVTDTSVFWAAGFSHKDRYGLSVNV